jgi:predicted nucleic acid-binding Zn finger protein
MMNEFVRKRKIFKKKKEDRNRLAFKQMGRGESYLILGGFCWTDVFLFFL